MRLHRSNAGRCIPFGAAAPWRREGCSVSFSPTSGFFSAHFFHRLQQRGSTKTLPSCRPPSMAFLKRFKNVALPNRANVPPSPKHPLLTEFGGGTTQFLVLGGWEYPISYHALFFIPFLKTTKTVLRTPEYLAGTPS